MKIVLENLTKKFPSRNKKSKDEFKQVFIKTVIVTTVSILLVAIGFISMGFFTGRLG